MTTVAKGTVLAERYRLEEKLGEGAMGSVWRAEHLMLGSMVAIKVLDESIAQHKIALARFLREARAAASLKSVHVVQIHDYGVDERVPYIAMEYLDGETLGTRLQQVSHLSPEDTALMITHVARGVGKAHETGVVHRDLKPDNIFLVTEDDEEYAKVLDFGVAKAGEGVFAATLTSAGKLLGTPAYMSAEQAAGRHVDHRTDIWAMAVIAFECLTGELPFMGDDLPDLLHAIHDGPIPVPSRLAPVPPGFDAWFARGVARNVDDRFYTAKELATELRKLCGITGGPAQLTARRRRDPDEGDEPEPIETTSARIAAAFEKRERADSDPSESLFDDIIRTQDILREGLSRPADDILTDDDFDDAPTSTHQRPATAALVAPTGEAPTKGGAPPPPRRGGAPTTSSKPPPKPRRGAPAAGLPASAAPEPEPAPAVPTAATPEPPSAGRGGIAPVSEPGTSLGTVVSVPPRHQGQFGLLVGTALIVVLGTVAGTVAFVLRGPERPPAPAVAPPAVSAATPSASAPSPPAPRVTVEPVTGATASAPSAD